MADRKSPGDPLGGMSARVWNGLIDASDDFKTRRLQAGTAPPGTRPQTDRIKVKNSSGADLGRFRVVEVPKSFLLDEVRANALWLDGIAVTGADQVAAILQQPAVQGDIVDAQVSGVCAAWVDVNDLGHDYAGPAAGQTALQSADSGPWRILYRPASTGSALCVVLFEGTVSQTAAGGISIINTGAVAIPPFGACVLERSQAGPPYAVTALDPLTVTLDWSLYKYLILNGSTTLNLNDTGLGFFAQETPAEGRVFTGYGSASGTQQTDWKVQPWGPAWDGATGELWPGLPGFKLADDPRDVGGGVYRAKFVVDNESLPRFRCASNWVNQSTFDSVLANCIRTWTDPTDVYDGLAGKPSLSENLTHPECVGPVALGRRSLNLLIGDVVECEYGAQTVGRGLRLRELIEPDFATVSAGAKMVDDPIGTIRWGIYPGRGWAQADGNANQLGVNGQDYTFHVVVGNTSSGGDYPFGFAAGSETPGRYLSVWERMPPP